MMTRFGTLQVSPARIEFSVGTGVAELLFVGLRDVDQLVLAGRRGRKDRGEELALGPEQNDRPGVDVCRNATHDALCPVAHDHPVRSPSATARVTVVLPMPPGPTMMKR